MKTSTKGLLMLCRHEAIVLSSYKDSVGVWTIGVGHTAAAGPPKPVAGLRITLQEALELLRKDIAKYEAGVNRAVKVPLAQHEFDALVSFHYNTGAISRATLTKRLNAGDRKGAAAGFMSWTKGGGRVIKGLVTRRTEERRLFETGDYGNISTVSVYGKYPGKSNRVPTAGLLSPQEGAGTRPSPAKPSTAAKLKAASAVKSEGLSKDEIKALQKRLYDLGFFEVGKADGIWGSKTTAAIAAFQDEHGLPISGRLDNETRQALPTAQPRKVSPARKATTMDDLRASGSRTVSESDQAATGATVGIAGGAVTVAGSAANYVMSNFSSARDTLSPFMDFFSDIPLWVYGVAIIALCLFMYWKASRVREIRLEDERTGKTAGQPDPSPSPPVEFGPEDPSELVEA